MSRSKEKFFRIFLDVWSISITYDDLSGLMYVFCLLVIMKWTEIVVYPGVICI